MSIKRPSLKINAISNLVSLLVQVTIGFLLTPFIISHLGQSGYGVWVLVGSFIGYYGLMNLGVGSAISRYIARFSAQNDTKSLNEIANTAFAMFCVTGATAIVISFLIAEPLAHFFKVDPEHFVEFKHIVWVLGIATGLDFPSSVFAAMIAARERYVAVNVVNILVALLRSGLTIIILLAGQGLAGIAYPALVATIVSFAAFFLLARKAVPEFKLQTECIRFATLKTLLVYGGYTTIIAVADILRLQIDSMVIGKMIGMAEVGVYGIAALLIRYMLNLVVSAMGVLAPRFATLDGARKTDELKDTFLRSLSISSFIACGVGLLALLCGRSFIFLWVGKEFSAAVPVLGILAVSYAFALSQTPGISLMYALNKHRYYAVATMMEAIANVLLSILLARHYGIIGVALGTAIPMIVVKFFVQPIYVSRIVGIRLRDYVKAIAPAFAVSLLMIVAQIIFNDFWYFSTQTESYFVVALSAFIFGGIYLILCLFFSPTLRRLIISFAPGIKEGKAFLNS